MERQLVIVGGVPGAGKSTALRHNIGRPDVLVLDPERLRPTLRWRLLVHVAHQLMVWAVILGGPALLGRTVLVHETATRPCRREGMLAWAALRGWRVRLLLVEVSRGEALAGQFARRRMVPEHEFERHWRRWQRLRGSRAQPCGVPRDVVPRAQAREALERLVGEDALTGLR